MKARALFTYFDGCEVLDFAGPLQALHEANGMVEGAYQIVHCGTSGTATTAQSLQVAALQPLPEPLATDLVFVPGYTLGATRPPEALARWVGACARVGARLFSVCTGSFVLARAGLLHGRRCTTHWKRIPELRAAVPDAHVLADRLFVRDERITSSAGIAAGIDMTLDLVAQDHGPAVAARVAREMVVYLRRDGAHDQRSLYLDYRSHLDPGVHVVQDFILSHPGDQSGLTELARLGHMSVRTLSRSFVKATGIPVGAYRRLVRLEHARMLLSSAPLTVDAVAEQAGFADARQLRRLWRQTFGETPSQARSRAPRGAA